jgi:uncharacterized protein YutE (UPF0331/DUF86 family)
MKSLKEILIEEIPLFEKSIGQFTEIYKDIKLIDLEKELTKTDLYLLDTYSARFSRCVDVFENKILKTIASIIDGKFMTALDLFNKMEQLKIISSARSFYKIKQLRNRMVHEYAEEDWILIIKSAISFGPILLESYKSTMDFCHKIIKEEAID